jgi:hypothetical protein
MVDAFKARACADAQAARLAPMDIAPMFLAEAIWHRTLCDDSFPTDDEVIDYLARCAADHVPVSGRQEHESAIHPVETYRVGTHFEKPADLAIEVRRSRGAGRRQYVATIVGPRTYVASHRTLTGIHREVERLHPGGTWSCSLSTRDSAAIRERWGLGGAP